VRGYKTRERKACEKQEFVRIARHGEELGCFKLGEVEVRAAFGEFLPSDHILIEGKKPQWVFLYKVTDTFFIQFNTEKHLEHVKEEEKKAAFWVSEKQKEIKECKDSSLIRAKDAELESYKELLAFLGKIPGWLKEIEEEELEEQRLEEIAERKEEEAEKKEAIKRVKNLVKVKRELWKIVKSARKMTDDADGVDEWYNTYYIGSDFSHSAGLMVSCREHKFSEKDIEWIAQEIIKKDNDSDFTRDNATEVFERFFSVRTRLGGGEG